MSVVQGSIRLPLEQASSAFCQAAATEGFNLDTFHSSPSQLILNKGMTAFSWGSKLTVQLDQPWPDHPDATRLTITTGETFAVTDWGRGKRVSTKILTAMGATVVES